MTAVRRNLERLAITALADVPSELIEPVLVRATGRTIVVWSNATTEELGRIYASARRATMVMT